jgi:hypothetical protein
VATGRTADGAAVMNAGTRKSGGFCAPNRCANYFKETCGAIHIGNNTRHHALASMAANISA